ncbi:transmembrane protein [Bacillus phage vB_BceH_LY2]|nr:transmembrane protein [Bacillus phage vB_BceH_LY2]
MDKNRGDSARGCNEYGYESVGKWDNRKYRATESFESRATTTIRTPVGFSECRVSDGSKYSAVNSSGRVQNAKKEKGSDGVEFGYNRRFSTGNDFNTDSVFNIQNFKLLIQKSKLLKSRVLGIAKKIAIPMVVISTLTLTCIGNTAYAETIDNNSFFDKGKSMFSGFMGDAVSNVTPNLIPDPIQQIINWVGEFNKIITDLPHNIAKMSAELLIWVYKLISELLLHTPLFLFENEWFTSMLRLFTGASIGGVVVLTVIESMKRMMSGFGGKKFRAMDFKRIIVRWALVSGVSAVFPEIFKLFFKCLNFISDNLLGMSRGIMEVSTLTNSFGVVDTLVLLGFDVMLISTVIPLLLNNGRRFFDLLVLGVISPVALGLWVFDSKRHFFTQWYNNLKHLSFVQVYHSFFLLIVGLFLFGTAFPLTFSGTLIKLLVVIGAFQRMSSPPKIIGKHMDDGKGNILDITKNPLKDISKSLTKNFNFSKSVITSPLKIWSKIKK